MYILKRLLTYLRPHWLPITIGGTCLLLAIPCGLFPPLVWKFIVDRVIVERHVEWLLPAVGVMLAVHLAGTGLRAVRQNLLGKVGHRFVFALRTGAYEKLQRQSMSYFHSRRTGDLMSRVMNDVDTLRDVALRGVDEVAANLLTFLGVAAILVWLNWKLGLASLVPVVLVVFLLKFFNRKVRRLYRRIRDRLGDVSAKLQDTLAGIQVVKAFAKEDDEAAAFRREADQYFQSEVEGVNVRTTYFPIVEFVSFWGNVIMIAGGAWLVLKGEFTIGGLVAYRGYWWHLYGPIRQLSDINDMVQRAIAAGSRVFELLDEPEAVKDAPGARSLDGVAGRIEFDRVSFAYDSNPEPALRGITLGIEPGRRVALVGRSGAGKSTLLALIPRFFDPTQGVVRLDGHDLRAIAQRSLRQKIAMVLQDTFLFNATVADNIRYGRPDASLTEVQAAAKAANAHDFIEALPEGYDTVVGERGVKLSGGQRQRIAVARAFLADPRILILDEPTSSVEAESEVIIQRAIDELMRGRTTLLTSHRLSVVRDADWIVVLEGGAIAEQGTHDDLMRQDGLYAAMYRSQMGLEAVGEGLGLPHRRA